MDKSLHKICTAAAMLTFLLGIRDGRLTLWRTGQDQPVQVYDIRADTLPPADRLALQNGITAQTREEVWQILENYMD